MAGSDVEHIKIDANVLLDIKDPTKIPLSYIGVSNGVAQLDSTGRVPSTQLPSYVDDVLEYASSASFPSVGENGKIYIDMSTNKTYRWSGSAYVEISPSLALGETMSTAYRGDRGAAAYAAAVTNVDDAPVLSSGKLITSGGVYTAVNDAKPVVITISNISSLPIIYNMSKSDVTENHVVVNHVLSNPAAMQSDWTIVTESKKITISGTISGTTNLTLYLMPKKI